MAHALVKKAIREPRYTNQKHGCARSAGK